MGIQFIVVEIVWALMSRLHGIGVSITGGKSKVYIFAKKERGQIHRLKVWMAYTWRAAALDFWKDPAGGNADQYWVQGYHFYMANNGNRVFDAYTQSGDCGGYNGWRDKEKARGE